MAKHADVAAALNPGADEVLTGAMPGLVTSWSGARPGQARCSPGVRGLLGPRGVAVPQGPRGLDPRLCPEPEVALCGGAVPGGAVWYSGAVVAVAAAAAELRRPPHRRRHPLYRGFDASTSQILCATAKGQVHVLLFPTL